MQVTSKELTSRTSNYEVKVTKGEDELVFHVEVFGTCEGELEVDYTGADDETLDDEDSMTDDERDELDGIIKEALELDIAKGDILD